LRTLADASSIKPAAPGAPNQAANIHPPAVAKADEATIQAQLPKVATVAGSLWTSGTTLGDLDALLLAACLPETKQAGFFTPVKRRKAGKHPNRPVV